MVTQETEKNIKFAYTICLQNHTSQHKADLSASKLHLTFIWFLFRESAVTKGLVKKYRRGWAEGERGWVMRFSALCQGWVVQFSATLRGWVTLFYYIDRH